MTFGEKVKAIREGYEREKWRGEWRRTRGGRTPSGLTGEELAELLGVSSKATIHNYETGKTVARDREVLRKVEELWEEVKQRHLARERFFGRRD